MRLPFALVTLATLSSAIPLTAPLVERQNNGSSGGGPLLGVDSTSGYVEDLSWLNGIPASIRGTFNIPGLVRNGQPANPAPAGSVAWQHVGSTGGTNTTSINKCGSKNRTASAGGIGAGTSAGTSAGAWAGPSAGMPQATGSASNSSTASTSVYVGGPLAGSSSTVSPTSTPTGPNAGTSASSGVSPAGNSSTIPPTSNTTGTSTGGCPPNMKGVTFNGGYNPGMFDTISAAREWITFSITPAAGGSTKAQAAYIPMMAFQSDVATAVNIVTGPNPPEWMLTFNEPDYSYMGQTPTMTGAQAAAAIAPLLAAKTTTKFVAPAVANMNGPFLSDFYAACNCKDFFSAYNLHSYHPDSSSVIADLQSFHSTYPDKHIWLTEVAPGQATPACSVSWTDATTFMNALYKFAAGSGFVDRVFWNTGNQITNPADHNVCNSYLLDAAGNPSPLLAAYQAVSCS